MRHKGNARAIQSDLPGVSEIHRDPPIDIRLDLPDAPLWLVRVCDQHSRFKYCVQVIHLNAF